MDRFTGGRLKAHLIMHGFMDVYTRWISEDDDEDVDGAANNAMGPDEEIIDGPEEEGAENGDGEEVGHGGGEEAGHDGEDMNMQ